MAHNAEVVTFQGSQLHVSRFAKRSEADDAFEGLGFHYASVLFKKDSHGWWSLSKSYGLSRSVEGIVEARTRERDAEEAAGDEVGGARIVGSVVARKKKNSQGRQFTLLELRFVVRGAEASESTSTTKSRRVVFASVERFSKALRAVGTNEAEIADFRKAASKSAASCVKSEDSDDEVPALSGTATEMLEGALASDEKRVEAWLEASGAVEAAVPRLGCGVKGVGTYGGKAKVSCACLDLVALRGALRTGAPEVNVLLIPPSGNSAGTGALFDVVLDCPAHALALELESLRFGAFCLLDEALREKNESRGGEALPPFPRRYAKRSFATFGTPLTGHELEDRRTALAH